MAKRTTKRATSKAGRPRAITPEIELQIIAFLRGGGSRGKAAEYVGVNRQTIENEALRNPKFLASLTRAEANCYFTHISQVAKAGKTDWRASAWLLERKWYEEWAKRDPGAITPEQLAGSLSRFVSAVQSVVPKRYHPKVADCLQDRLKELGNG